MHWVNLLSQWCAGNWCALVFARLWLMAGANLLWENSTADCLVTGGCCWFSMREQYCCLVGWQAKRTQRMSLSWQRKSIEKNTANSDQTPFLLNSLFRQFLLNSFISSQIHWIRQKWASRDQFYLAHFPPQMVLKSFLHQQPRSSSSSSRCIAVHAYMTDWTAISLDFYV